MKLPTQLVTLLANIIAFASSCKLSINDYKCKKLKSLKQCLTATQPTSHN